MNFNQSTNSLLNQSDTTCANQSTSSSHFNQSAAVTYNSFSTVEAPSRTDFSFDYKLNNDSGVIQTQSARDKFSSSVPDSEEEADVIDQFPDDLFSPDDFDSEFTEEVKTDSLPQLSSPRRQSTNQSFVVFKKKLKNVKLLAHGGRRTTTDETDSNRSLESKSWEL